MEIDLVPIVVVGGLYALIAYLVYLRTRKNERLALIAAGKEAGIFNEPEKKIHQNESLKYGFLMVGLGVGLLIGEFMKSMFNVEPTVAYLSMTLLFGGLALLIYHSTQKKQQPIAE